MSNLISPAEFVVRYDNEFVEAGGSPNAVNQCVDLINKYFEEVLGIGKILGTNAVDFPSKVGGDFEWIPNDEVSDIPQAFDIPIWGKPIGKYVQNGKVFYAGHIAFALDGCTKDNLICFGQNWPVGSNAHRQEHNYNNVLGWLRYKKPMNTNITKFEINKGLHDFLFVENKFSEGDIRDGMAIFKSGVINEYSKRLSESEEKVVGLGKKIIDLETQLKLKGDVIEIEKKNAVEMALIEPNQIIHNQKIKISLSEVKLKHQEEELDKYHQLSENGIGLIMKGLGVLWKKKFGGGQSEELPQSNDNNKNMT